MKGRVDATVDLSPSLPAPGSPFEPQVRNAEGQLVAATWDFALSHAAERLREIIARHGSDAVAFYGGRGLDSETAYLVGKLFKGRLGANHTDVESRGRMDSTPRALREQEAGLSPYQLPGYRLVEDSADRAEVERFWRVPQGAISPQPGLNREEMFPALESGRLKAIWIVGANPTVGPEEASVRRALAAAELVIVQDRRCTETTHWAHVVLPAAACGAWELTLTSEQTIPFSPTAIGLSGPARPDYEIVAGLAQGLSCSGFDFPNRAAVWNEFIQLTHSPL